MPPFSLASLEFLHIVKSLVWYIAVVEVSVQIVVGSVALPIPNHE